MRFQAAKVSFLRYLKGTDLSKAYLLAFAAVIPITLANYYNNLSVGIAMAIGVLLCAPSDVPGNLRHRFFGMLFAAFFGVFATLCIGYTKPFVWVNLPLFFLLTFFISYFSVYGFRASLISLAGLLAMVLSFANLGTLSVWLHATLIGCGSLWYILISTLFLKIRPQKHLEIQLGETAEKTAEFLRIRGKMLTAKHHRNELQRAQFSLQTSINELHENIREALLSNRQQSGSSNSSRRQLLIFIDLVDILELSIAHPVNFKRLDKLAEENRALILKYKSLIYEMSIQLQEIAEVFLDGEKLKKSNTVSNLIEEIEAYIQQFEEKINETEARETLILLQNLLDFEKKQGQKIQSIQRVLSNIKKREEFNLKTSEVKQFLTPTDYSFKILLENFSLKAPMFRHALRLAVLMLIGVLIGMFFKLQNSYWILLTLVVIMRPSYGLTKERSKKRILGTFLGGIIAVILIFLISNPVVYAVLGILSMILAFSMIQKNYVGAAAFITLNVVFIYALLQPNALAVIQYRIIDTFIGAGLAVIGSFLLWPSWEHNEMNAVISKTIQANMDYLKAIDNYYHTKGNLPSAYKLKRKEAFLAMGNLSAAFQRMTQEPKSKQKEYKNFYRYTALNHTFLSSLASLGNFIRNHNTTEASVYFETYISNIIYNLSKTIENLSEEKTQKELKHINFEQAEAFIIDEEKKLIQLKTKELKEGKEKISEALRTNMQEIQLISEQLRWLYEVSLNLKI
ncbi:FUSC family membrane protein [Mesonia maritima]|uniref:FUSC family protein n=1 Tax=Mesonia maritima TaxID=1793873 RepID=UPI0036298CF8